MTINNFNMKSPHFCYAPWVGIDIDQSGYIKPCCKFDTRMNSEWNDYNITNISIDDYKENINLKKLKESFLLGEKPIECNRCWKDETANYPSKRLLDYKYWKKDLIDLNLEVANTLMLSLPINNICNLKCRICGPHASSSWIKEYQDIYNENTPNNLFNLDKNWENILNLCDDILELHIYGGEPFLYDNNKHLELLERLSKSKNSNKIKLHYNTNCSIFPEKKYWEFFENFGCVDIQPSIDDFGKRFEYNRKNAIWKEVEENLFHYRDLISKKSNLQLSLSTTVSVFTIYYLPDFLDYIKKNKLPMPWFGRLNRPKYLRCSIFPQKYKKIIKEKLLSSKFKNLHNISDWILDSDENLLEQFRLITKKHDIYRNENFSDVFYEIYPYLFES